VNKTEKVIKKFGTWAVTEYGIEHLIDPVYEIHKNQVHMDNNHYTWKNHMADKNWGNLTDFNTAHDYAMQLWPKDGLSKEMKR